MQERVSSERPKARWWRSRRALWLVVVPVLILALGGAALAQGAGAGDEPAAPGVEPGGGHPGPGCPWWRAAPAGQATDGQQTPPNGGWRGGRQGRPGRWMRAPALNWLGDYLEMKPADLLPLAREYGRGWLILGAPLAKLSDRPLAEVLKQRAEVAGDLDVDLGDYLVEVEKLLAPLGPKPAGAGQGAPGAESGAGESGEVTTQ